MRRLPRDLANGRDIQGDMSTIEDASVIAELGSVTRFEEETKNKEQKGRSG